MEQKEQTYKVAETFKTLNEVKGQYAFIKYGHGQFEIMRGSSDGEHEGSFELAEKLKEIINFQDDNFFIATCMHPAEFGMHGGTFGYWKKNDIYKEYLPDRKFHNFIALHYMMVYKQKELKPYLEKLRSGTIVGGKHLEKLCDWFKADFVETPIKDAYYSIDEWYPKIKKSPVLFGAGMASSIAQYRLWKETDLTTVDLGSLLDAMLDMPTRGWINENREQIKKFYAI